MEFWNERLSKALIARSKKPVDLVKATGKSAASISGWLNGQTKMIEADNAMLVCAFLRISPWWLMFGKGKSGLEEELPTFAEQAVAIRNPDEEAVFDVLDVVAVAAPEDLIRTTQKSSDQSSCLSPKPITSLVPGIHKVKSRSSRQETTAWFLP